VSLRSGSAISADASSTAASGTEAMAWSYSYAQLAGARHDRIRPRRARR